MMNCSLGLLRQWSSFLKPTSVLLKKVGKPTETPDYKQAYLPYETAPTKSEIDQARRRFSQAYHGRSEFRKLVEVKDVPPNLYTYGKEGMSLPIAIFKTQEDPVIGPEWTYPGIYENKIACKDLHMHELIEMERNKAFESPWQRDVLDERVKRSTEMIRARMGMLNMKEADVFQKDRGSSAAKKGTETAVGSTPK